MRILPVAPTRVVTPAAQPLPNADLHNSGTSPQQVSRFAAALIQHRRILIQRDLIASNNALQSRAVKLGELYQLLMTDQDTGLDNAARVLRKKLMQDDSSSDLKQVLDYTDGDAAKLMWCCKPPESKPKPTVRWASMWS
ncbi:hypothetical protein F2S71_22310 [Pseudomonas syringae pv. actinidiae]|nr:hypothetical protein [Pseudomonas syringae pv. actinidiae]